ncbi:MAG TPA: Imm21 family immunity protein [Asanoa sp.]|nr:Imm21 family immunity protein [Asanoa sp.]
MIAAPGRLAALTEPAKVVLLDCDGPICTLFGRRAAVRVVSDLRELLAGHGVDTAEEIGEAGPLDVLRAAAHLAPPLVGHIEAALRVAEIEAAASAESTLGAFDVLRACIDTERGLAIVSETSTDAIHAYLRRRDRARYFAAVVGRDSADPVLPAASPHRITRAVQALGADPAECLFVSAAATGVAAARQAGVAAVGYAGRPGTAERLASAGAHVVIDAMDQLAHAVATTRVRRHTLPWIDSTGGPLVVIPTSVLPQWHGTGAYFMANSDSDDWGDYGRACAVNGYAGLIRVGDAQALVLADEPAATTYLADRRTFVRWIHARSEADLIRLVPRAIESANWEPVGEWVVTETVEMFDSALAGTDRQADPRLAITVEPGTYRVRTAHVTPEPDTSMVITQLIPTAHSAR